MEEKIKNVTINLNYYSGEDLYSDGVIEDELLKIVRENANYDDVIKSDNRWPILYHLSTYRGNIVEWYPFDKNATLLEIGAGCGAITGTLAQKVKRVKCVELSKKRSIINATRHSEFTNIEINVGDFNKMTFEEQYDYITLIGVLEYAPSFSKSSKPFHELLKYVKTLLKPGGKLLIAIENKFGLKYWAGAKEDHTAKLFDSIEGYVGNNKVRTFSKSELSEILEDVGFRNLDFYYPMPDYKLPFQIFSDQRLPAIGELRELTHNYDYERLGLFNESKVYDELITNDKFSFFANSFLIICD